MMSSSFTLKYKVLEKIGEGSFSEVLKCQNRVTEEYFAAKRLKKCYRNRQEVYECPEIVAMRKVSRHPNILYIIETHYEQLLGRVTLIFELLDMSMYDYMKVRKRCIPEDRVKNYLYQLLKGLHHLHKNGLFHRDIKPENILIKITNYDPLDRNKIELIKLGDLGSIRGIYSKPPYTEYISTRWYRSPECLLTTGYYGPKMDIWAVGCVYYEMLTLKPLFPGNDEIDQIHKIHQLLGTPPARLLTKFRRHKSRNCDFSFPTVDGAGFGSIMPSLTLEGRDMLKQMLIYDPDTRCNVRRLLEHKYFKDYREHDLMWRRRSLSTVKKTVSDVSIGDYITEKKKEAAEVKSIATEKKSVLPAAQSVVIANVLPDSTKALKSKSGSINLNRIIKKSNISKPVTVVRPSINNRPHVQPQQQPTVKPNIQPALNRTWDINAHIAAKLSFMRSAKKPNFTSGIPKLKMENKAHSTEKVRCQGSDNYFQYLKGRKRHDKVQPNRRRVIHVIYDAIYEYTGKIKQPITKKTSDPGSSKNSEMGFIGKQFVSKSFVLPRTAQTKEKLTTIREQEKNRPTFDDGPATSTRIRAPDTRISIERPQGRKSTRTKFGTAIQ